MEEKKLSTDGFQWLYDRYIGDDPERVASLQEELAKAGIASQIYTIRNKLRMSREDLAEFSGLTPEAIEDLEESDYDGSWEDAISLINRAFERWIKEVVIPAARMTPDEYSIKAVSA
jgi:DNA-binding XRE family transcriptional regulator